MILVFLPTYLGLHCSPLTSMVLVISILGTQRWPEYMSGLVVGQNITVAHALQPLEAILTGVAFHVARYYAQLPRTIYGNEHIF